MAAGLGAPKSHRGEPVVSELGGLSLESVTAVPEVTAAVRHEEWLWQHETLRRLEESELSPLGEKKRQSQAAAAARR